MLGMLARVCLLNDIHVKNINAAVDLWQESMWLSFSCPEKGNPRCADTGRESEANAKESKTDDTFAFTARVIHSGLNTNDVANMEILGRKLCPVFEAQITKRIIMYIEHIPVYVI